MYAKALLPQTLDVLRVTPIKLLQIAMLHLPFKSSEISSQVTSECSVIRELWTNSVERCLASRVRQAQETAVWRLRELWEIYL